jgi:seryl-tRNA synthetase
MASNVELMQKNIRERNGTGDPELVASLYLEYRHTLAEVEELRRQRNEWASQIPKLQDKGARDEAICKATATKTRARELEAELRVVKADLERAAHGLPNTTYEGTPIGPELAAVEISTFGERRDWGTFVPRDHLELCEMHGFVDFEAGANVVGSKWAFFCGDLALLELALVTWSMNRLAASGFVPTLVPDVCRVEILEACGFSPRGRESQTFFVGDGGNCGDDDLALVGTAEIPLAGMAAGKVFDESELPRRVAGFSHAFRREAGARGAKSRGIYRLKQFSKVEAFVHCTPAQASGIVDEMVELQVELLSSLSLSGRVLEMPTEELGASAHRKIDVEVWMPGRSGGAFGEVCSASDCTDYQSRRLNTQFAPSDGGRRQFPSTINATGLAIPRVMLAILETHQQEDGTILLPGVLAELMGKDVIELDRPALQ